MLSFKPGQTSQTISVEILDDDEEEDDETFKVVLSSPQGCVLGRQTDCEVTIIDDDGPGELFFASREHSIFEGEGAVQIVVERTRGIQGTVGGRWRTHNGSAVDRKHFVGGTGTVIFEPGVMRQIISIEVVDNGIYGESALDFAVILTDAFGGGKIIDGAQAKHSRSSTSTSVRIQPNPRRNETVDEVAEGLDLAALARGAEGGEGMKLTANDWCHQFRDALIYEGEDSLPLGLIYVITM